MLMLLPSGSSFIFKTYFSFYFSSNFDCIFSIHTYVLDKFTAYYKMLELVDFFDENIHEVTSN